MWDEKSPIPCLYIFKLTRMQGVSYNFIIKQIYIYLDRLKLIMINNFFL